MHEIHGRFLLWLWALIECWGVDAAQTYLSEKDNWNISYRVESVNDDCNGQMGFYNRTTISEVDKLIANLRKDKPACSLTLEVKLRQEAAYDGIVVTETGAQLRGFAIGNSTTAKIFNDTYPARWLMEIHTSTSTGGGNFFIKPLDDTVATKAHPSLMTTWSVVLRSGTIGKNELFRLPIPMWKGGFQVGQVLDPTQSFVRGATELVFHTSLQRPDWNVLQLKDQWHVEYYVIPHCATSKAETACRSGNLALESVYRCVAELEEDDCSVKVEARLIQQSPHDGMVYDTQGSRTAALAVSKEFLSTALFDHTMHWEVNRVQFIGFSETSTGSCSEGQLLYKTELEDKLPSANSPLSWSNWRGSQDGDFDFQYVGQLGDLDTYETATGFYRAHVPVKLSPYSDFQAAVKQDQRCHWEQSKAVISATVLLGPDTYYNALGDAWALTYVTSLPQSKECLMSYPQCNYRGSYPLSSLTSCIEQVKAVDKECPVRLDVELFQKRGHSGVLYTGSGKTTFGLAMTQKVTAIAFKSPISYPIGLSFISDIRFDGTDANLDCQSRIRDSLVYRNGIKNDHPVNLRQWKPLSRGLYRGEEVYRPTLDPESDFELAVDQHDRDCRVDQLSAFFKVTFLF